MTINDTSPEDDSFEHITCPNCDAVYRIPRTNKTLRIVCKHCQVVFYKNLYQPSRIKQKRYFFAVIAIGLAIVTGLVILFSGKNSPGANKQPFQTPNNTPVQNSQSKTSSNWISISYGGLVDGSILTHNGETVREVVRKIANDDNDLKGLVQPYLEPYSILCPDVLLSQIDPDTLPYKYCVVLSSRI